jgi:exonuclease III
LLDSLTEEENSIQVLCLCETWITPSKLDLLYLKGFKLATSFSRTNHDGGGVCILVKEDIESEELCEISKLSVETIFETCAIEITNLNLIVVTMYFPDKKRNPELFFSSLERLLQTICRKKFIKKNIVITGDFNIDMLVVSALATTLMELNVKF